MCSQPSTTNSLFPPLSNHLRLSTSSFSNVEKNREPIDYAKLQSMFGTPNKKKKKTYSQKLKKNIKNNIICFKNNEQVNNQNLNALTKDKDFSEDSSSKSFDQETNLCSFYKTNSILKFFPILESLKDYNFKKDFPKDLFAGITVAVLHIPQAIAYSLLAGLPPIYGLYTSFFPVLVYSFLGTSKHVSIGTFAIISIMLYNIANKIGSFNNKDHISMSMNFTSIENAKPLEIYTSLSFLIGLIMILMGTFNLGALSIILSDQLVSSFCSASALHVFTSQFPLLFGIKAYKHTTHHFKLAYAWIDLFQKIQKTNFTTLIISTSVLSFLIFYKNFFLKFIKKKFNFDLKLPIDLVIIIIVTYIGHYINWKDTYKVKIMGLIPTGLPEPKLPRTDLFLDLIYDALTLTMVIFALLISLAKLYGNQFKYKVCPNQELIALGTANFVGSFFSCFPASTSLARSSVQSTTGCKSQLVGIISSLIVLLVLLFLAPLFYHLPECVLACIILIALKTLIFQIGDLRKNWKNSRTEGLIWFVTFFSTTFFDVDIGLITGIIFSLIITLFKLTMPNSTILGKVPFTEIYVDSEFYSKASQVKGIRIFQFCCPLFFLNCDYFKEMVFNKTLHVSFKDVSKMNKEITKKKNYEEKIKIELEDVNSCSEESNNNSSLQEEKSLDEQLFEVIYEINEEIPVVHTIIIDCSGISYIDSSGVKCLNDVANNLDTIGLNCYFVNCPSPLLKMLKRMQFIEKLPKHGKIFATIHDAVLYTLSRK